MDRPGIKTTEFWLTLLAVVLGGLPSIFSDKPWAQVAGLVAGALATMGYSIARANVKREPTTIINEAPKQ